MQINKLNQTEVLARQGWLEAAQEMNAFNWDFSHEVDLYGQYLADSVVSGRLSVRDLRQGVAWANAHDHETVERLGNVWDAASNQDRSEATARRLAHHSGRWALERVKNEDRLFIYRQNYWKRVSEAKATKSMTGMFYLESEDSDIVQLAI